MVLHLPFWAVRELFHLPFPPSHSCIPRGSPVFGFQAAHQAVPSFSGRCITDIVAPHLACVSLSLCSLLLQDPFLQEVLQDGSSSALKDRYLI